MVSPLRGLNAAQIATKLSKFLETRAKGAEGALSLRALERLTGIPHQRLSDFLAAPEARSAATVSRIARGLASPALHTPIRRERTVRVDAPFFTPESIGALDRPDGATGFRFVYEEEGYPGGYGSTVLTAFRNDAPVDAIGLVPGGVEGIASVIWYTGPRAR